MRQLLKITACFTLIVSIGCTSNAPIEEEKKINFNLGVMHFLKKAEAEDSEEIMIITDEKMLKAELKKAIEELRQPSIMDISMLKLSEQPDLDIKNLYFELLSENPDLKYAYDLTSNFEDRYLNCQLDFMPYKTNNYPESFTGIPIISLQALIETASAHLGEEPTAIQILNPTLSPDQMNYALQQAGGGYINCILNKDATQIIYQPPIGFTIEESLAALQEADMLADAIIAQLIVDNMTDLEKAEILYSYVTENVKYDGRYNTDFQNMPYESQTALGALKDGTAICGGYAHAVKLLLEKAGIPCLNVTGTWFNGHHMWNIIYLDQEWLWCDATADRGNTRLYGLHHFGLHELDADQYHWDANKISSLLVEK